MKGISQHRRWLNRYEYFLDEYEYYNFDPAATTLSHSRKGRSKKEASLNTNRSNPAGHERKVLTKLQNAERKKKMCNIKTTEK
ncbi:Nuclear protein 1 [Acropora cervicornis]|uniref:Nuclear protein 1 n=1 Tax=Acropora cervicornis TaxID=6130 RepID=A0AAD9V1V4_ACRCE|nr:Nuclear protein 1 [Acropora cervicornis]